MALRPACLPAQEAAAQLKVGLSVLKRICRQMGLARWPYRTRQSLRGVIAKTQQYYHVRPCLTAVTETLLCGLPCAGSSPDLPGAMPGLLQPPRAWLTVAGMHLLGLCA